MAFQYWWNRGSDRRTKYLTLGGSYHGDTVGGLSLGAGGFGTDLFDPLRFGGVIRSTGYEDPGWLQSALALLEGHGPALSAAVIEPLVQGAGGMQMTSPDHVNVFAKACQDSGVLLICDEVATGFGRTGTLFASETCGIRPDIMCIGKGITGGYLPMSATVASGQVAEAFLGEDLGPETFYHGHSYSGNALAAAVALRHLELFAEWDVLANVAACSSALETRIRRDVVPLHGVGEFRLQGLMAGIELTPPRGNLKWGRKVCAGAVDRGVLLRPVGDVIVLMPILTSTISEINRIVDALAESIAEVCGPES
jgi:adenosylmethionine-8-amino-7-oxononanoate aminotransferase